MPKTCSVCRHPRREEIDAALHHGEPTRLASERFALTYPQLKAHRRSAHHVVQTPRQRDTGTPHTAATLLRRISECRGDAEALGALRIAVRTLPTGERRLLVEELRRRAGRGEVGAEPERRVA